MTFVLTGDVQTRYYRGGCEVGIRSVSAHGNPDRLMPGVSLLNWCQGNMRRRFLRAISVTTVGLSVMLGAGCQSPSSGPPKVSGLEKTNLTVGAVPVAD